MVPRTVLRSLQKLESSMLSVVTLLLGGYVAQPIPVTRVLASCRTPSVQLLTDAERFAGRHWEPGIGWLQGPPSAPAAAPLDAPRVVQPPPTAPSTVDEAGGASTATATATTTHTITPANAVGNVDSDEHCIVDEPAALTNGREMISKLAESSLARMKSILRLEESHYGDLLQVNRYDDEGELTGGVRGFTAPEESALSWCTLTLDNESAEACKLALRAWNAPVTGAPHVHAEVGCSGEEIHLLLDFLPRADADCAQPINAISNELYEHSDEPRDGLTEAEYRRAGERWWLEAAERWCALDANPKTFHPGPGPDSDPDSDPGPDPN